MFDYQHTLIFQGFSFKYNKKPSDIILVTNELNILPFYTGQKVNKKNVDMFILLTGQKITEFKNITTNTKTATQNTSQKVSKNIGSNTLESSIAKLGAG